MILYSSTLGMYPVSLEIDKEGVIAPLFLLVPLPALQKKSLLKPCFTLEKLLIF